jgi:protein phosphatase
MSAAFSWSPPSPQRLDVVGQTHPGLRRETNEDAYAVHPDLGLLVVADGMGGHAAGEVASEMTVETVSDLLLDPTQGWWPSAPLPPRSAGAALTAAIQRANLEVYTAGQRAPELRGMGTTVVAALTFRGCLAVAHVGDSRAYLLRERWLARLTEDHTVANARRHAGVDLLNLARFAGYWHALTRSVGSAPSVDVEVRYLTPHPGDVLLLCSDGLTNAIDDHEIAATLATHRDLEAAADQLIARANESGGPDNITVVLQRWS